MLTKKYSINLIGLILYPLAIWLGVTGRVGWWTIGLIFLSGSHITWTWEKKQW